MQKFYDNLATNKLPNITADQLVNILFYAVYSVALAAALGYFFYKVVRGLDLDISLRAFRFINTWHYYFKGEILRTSEYKMRNRGRVISTEVDLIVKNDDGKSNLFSGLLMDYRLDTNNELDTLYLTGTTRFSQSLQANKHIPGDIGIWRKIFGCLTLFISWMCFSSLIMSFFPPSNGAIPLSLGAKIVNFIILIVMFLVSNQILKIVPSLYFGS